MGEVLLELVWRAIAKELCGHPSPLSSDVEHLSRVLARAALDAVAHSPDAVIDAMIEWTPSPYEISTSDREAYRAMIKAGLRT